METGGRWFRLLAAVSILVCLFGTAGCGRSALDDVIRAISRSQAVDESTVRTALQEAALTEGEQLTLAREWADTLPSQELPNLDNVLDDMARYGREQLKSATCQALTEMASTGQVPSGEDFVRNYLDDVATSDLPEAELESLVQTFDDLWSEAAAGTLTSTDVRLALLEIQYC